MIFVSHKHVNQEIAEALVDFIVATLEIKRDQIRCTSTPGSQLPFGKPIESQLKNDINQANAIFALLTQESKNAHWVLFELGAAWALGKTIVPILASGLSIGDLPGPLPNYPCVVIGDSDANNRMIDAMRQVSQELNVKFDFDANSQRKLELFIQKYVPTAKNIAYSVPTLMQARLFILSNDIFYLAVHVGTASFSFDHPQFVISRDKELLRMLQIDAGRPFQVSSGQDATTLWLDIGAIISIRYPEQAAFFEAGWNLPQALVKEDSQEVQKYFKLIGYPEELIESAEPAQAAWQIRQYFESALNMGNSVLDN